MRRRAGPMMLAVAMAAAPCAAILPALPAAAQPAGPPGAAAGPAEVGVITLERSEVPFSVTVPGRAALFLV